MTSDFINFQEENVKDDELLRGAFNAFNSSDQFTCVQKSIFSILERRLSDFLLTFEFENKVFYDSQTGDFQFSKSDKIFKPIDNSAIEWIKKYRLPLFLKTHTIYQYNQVSYLLVLKLFDR